jgi:hypothetical protein
LLYSGLRAEGTVIARQQTGSSHKTYAPVFRFEASDGRTYVVSSDVFGRESAFRLGERVRVLYRPDDPQTARIDAFAQLWTFALVFGVVGAGFSLIPALILTNWMRRRRTSGDERDTEESLPVATDGASPGFRRALGVILAGSGLVLLAVGLGVVARDSSSLDGQGVIVSSLGVLLAASGVLIGQWVAAGSRLNDALGGAAITSMAVLFGWVAIYGDAAGFSGGVSVGGAALTSSGAGAATPARIAFGIGASLLGLASLFAWKRVLLPRRSELQ